MNSKPKILLIYTGGTIGMMLDSKTGTLQPFDFGDLYERIPEIRKFEFKIDSVHFDPVIDSSDMQPSVWAELANLIEKNYSNYDGFVILHGSDTMAYTASALSFMLENLSKPVILTGSQLPIGMIRTDGKENLITALEIAAAKTDGKATVPEVCIYFEYQLYRGNRTYKNNAEHFEAFRSDNYPVLAKAGININYNHRAINNHDSNGDFSIFTKMDTNVASLKLFPGIEKKYIDALIHTEGLKGLILETFGSGNAFTQEWFLKTIKQAVDNGVVVVNVTQCRAGFVNMGKYEASVGLKNYGVISGYDITYEAALTKMMYLFGNGYSNEKIKKLMQTPIRGEMSV